LDLRNTFYCLTLAKEKKNFDQFSKEIQNFHIRHIRGKFYLLKLLFASLISETRKHSSLVVMIITFHRKVQQSVHECMCDAYIYMYMYMYI